MREQLRKYQLFIPIIIILFWASLALFHENFFINKDGDFQYFYNAGLRLIKNPPTLYIDPLFLNLPVFAFSFIIFALFPYWEAHLLLWGLNILLGIIFVLELNKILKLIGLKKEITRMTFIIIAVVNWTIYVNFYYPQIKIIVAVIIMFVTRREIEYKYKNKEKTKLYYFINYFLIIYSLSISPYYIFMWIILLIDDIGRMNILKKESILKILTLIVIFIGQNFLFLIYPHLISDYLSGGFSFFRLFYTDEIPSLKSLLSPFSLYFLIVLITSNFIIAFSNYRLETKLGLSGIFYLIFSGYGTSVCFISVSMILFLFTLSIKEENNVIATIMKNKTHSFGLLVILLFNISTVYNTVIQDEFPFLFQPPLSYIVIYRLPILLCVMLISLLLLKISIKPIKDDNLVIIGW